jgi:acylphosphatase
MKCVRVEVSGRVQGVMFRDSCRREADRLGVVGWVRNEPGGSVLVVAEGPGDAVDALVAWCRTGPPGARVTGVDVTAASPSGGQGFEVRW